MIQYAETLIKYGYLVMDLPPHSAKTILAICDNCGKIRKTTKDAYRAFCRSCSALLCEKHKGKNHPNYGKHGEDAFGYKGGSVESICIQCGKIFPVPQNKIKKGGGKYCSRKCYYEAKKGETIKGTCETCGNKFPTCSYDIKHGRGKYCCQSCANRGKNNPNFGKHISKDQKEKQSASMKGNKNPNFGKEMLKGEKSPYYKGGRRASDVRSRANRRGLGRTLIYPVEEGEHGHHFTNEHIGGIPEDVHNSIGGRRKKHRTRILQWLKANDKKKYLKVLCILAKQ